jgi:hypothetical protein
VDNCASISITNCLADFITPPKTSNKSILGIGGKATALKIGTWNIEDNTGRVYTLTLPNTYFAPNAPCHLLSHQHWSQTEKDNRPSLRGTWCTTYNDSLVLWWGQQKYKKSCTWINQQILASFAQLLVTSITTTAALS